MACCPECHYTFEVVHVLPRLPVYWRYWLLSEHAALTAAGNPPAAVRQHAAEEMEIFARFVPETAVAQLPDGSQVRIMEKLRSDHAALLS